MRATRLAYSKLARKMYCKKWAELCGSALSQIELFAVKNECLLMEITMPTLYFVIYVLHGIVT
jgi:hypothetical protein